MTSVTQNLNDNMRESSYGHLMQIVSRVEIAECVEEVFQGEAVTCSHLVEFAADHGARAPVLDVLGRLNGDGYRDLRELWGELGDVPVEL